MKNAGSSLLARAHPLVMPATIAPKIGLIVIVLRTLSADLTHGAIRDFNVATHRSGVGARAALANGST